MSYQKPMVLLNDDLAEGVYAASGATASSGGVAVTVTFTGNNDNEWYKCSNFHVSLAGDYGVQVTITFDFDKSGVSVNGGDGNTLSLSNPEPEFDITVVGDWNIQCNGATLVTTRASW